MYHASDSTGNCSVCRKTFRDPQDFYEHFDNCVMLKVMQGDPSEAINHMRLAEVNDDEEVKKTLKHHFQDAEDPTDQPDHRNYHGDVSVYNDEPKTFSPASRIKRYPSEDGPITQRGTEPQNVLELEPDWRLDAEDPADQPDYKNSHGDVSVYNDELETFLPASRLKRYPSEDGSITQKGTKPQNVLGPEPDPQSAKENNLPGQINLDVHEPAIGDNDTIPFTRYKCQECDKLDTDMKGTLIRHINDMHFPRRKFFCPEKGCHDVWRPRQHKIRAHVLLAHRREPTDGELLLHKRDMPCPHQCPGCALPIRTWDEFTKCYPEHCTYKVFYD
jgi:hypothetical protein